LKISGTAVRPDQAQPNPGPGWGRLAAFALALWLPAGALAGPETPAPLEVVRDGKFSHLVYPTGATPPVSKGKEVILQDRWQTFLVDARLGDEFTLTLRMAIDGASRSATTLMLMHGEESSHLGFSGSKEAPFTQGRAFLRDTSDQLQKRPTPPFILAGQMFDLVLTSRRLGPDLADLEVTLNGEPFARQSGKCPPIVAVGLRPWVGTIRIESMTLRGQFQKGGVEAKPFEPKKTKGGAPGAPGDPAAE